MQKILILGLTWAVASQKEIQSGSIEYLSRIWSITDAWVMNATMRIAPRQVGHASGSTSNYNGWDDAYFGYGGGWRGRSRPYVQITNVYVSPRYRNVYVNRNVTHSVVNYRNVDRYAGVHPDVYFDRDGRGSGRNDGRSEGRNDGRGKSRDGRNDGRDNRNDRDRGFPYGSDLGRSAQPRNDRPAATPDGYRSGSPDREAQQNPRTNQGSLQAAPDRRRTEPSGRAADMTVSPDAIRQAKRDRGTGDGAERTERSAPRTEQQQSPPRQDRARDAQSGAAAAPPQQREAQPRQAKPRSNDGDRRPPDRNERSSNDGERGARERRGGQ